MVVVEAKRDLDDGERAKVLSLLGAASAADSHPALGDQQLLALLEGPAGEFHALLAMDDGSLVAYGQLLHGPARWAFEFAVEPARRHSAIAATMLGAARDLVAGEGGGELDLWRHRPSEGDDALAASIGLAPWRDLLQLRRTLPIGERSGIDVRGFVAGEDEDAWLDVNNRAFASHPEQGGWDLASLLAREQQPWFDPNGFLLHERDGRLAGFCWTKIHADPEPALGEIYAIAVDPDFEGCGLGRALVVAGLESLAARGVQVGMLYVDAENTAAAGLYRKLGFTTDHIDRAYAGRIAGAG